MCVWVLQRPEEGAGSCGTGVTGGCELPDRYWALDLKVIGTFHCWAISLSSPWVSCNNTEPVSILIYYFCLKLFTISNTLCKLTRNLFRLFSPTFCVSLRVCACFCSCVDYVCACFCLCAHACEGQRSKSENCPQLLFHLIYWGRVSRAQWFG